MAWGEGVAPGDAPVGHVVCPARKVEAGNPDRAYAGRSQHFTSIRTELYGRVSPTFLYFGDNARHLLVEIQAGRIQLYSVVGAAQPGKAHVCVAHRRKPGPRWINETAQTSAWAVSVEPAGVEPASANRSLETSTCVFYPSVFLVRSSAGRPPLTDQLRFVSPARRRAPRAGQPDLSSFPAPPRAGRSGNGHVRVTYAASAS